jgi:hypothetical protein
VPLIVGTAVLVGGLGGGGGGGGGPVGGGSGPVAGGVGPVGESGGTIGESGGGRPGVVGRVATGGNGDAFFTQRCTLV